MPSGPCPRLLRENHQFPWNAGLCGLFDGLHPNKRRPPAAARAETLRLPNKCAFGEHLGHTCAIIILMVVDGGPAVRKYAHMTCDGQADDEWCASSATHETEDYLAIRRVSVTEGERVFIRTFLAKIVRSSQMVVK